MMLVLSSKLLFDARIFNLPNLNKKNIMAEFNTYLKINGKSMSVREYAMNNLMHNLNQVLLCNKIRLRPMEDFEVHFFEFLVKNLKNRKNYNFDYINVNNFSKQLRDLSESDVNLQDQKKLLLLLNFMNKFYFSKNQINFSKFFYGRLFEGDEIDSFHLKIARILDYTEYQSKNLVEIIFSNQEYLDYLKNQTKNFDRFVLENSFFKIHRKKLEKFVQNKLFKFKYILENINRTQDNDIFLSWYHKILKSVHNQVTLLQYLSLKDLYNIFELLKSNLKI